ncbi:uncharacterized protein LOC100277296 [Zea mays]|uniref:Uncharacterized protein n=1 Tax=Zea mays TaxID=4577 RepID=B6TSG8_MAIZE|nr:uncharacterized protein LOC100277296 [Zea mays]ACG40051.1 hypothetical protein [Zea mays]|eukprot:NP_001144373.1 uncharacterized protein LOC100277296 [Zea mays]
MHREPFGESFPLVAADRYQAWAVTSGCGGSVRRGRREVGPVAIAGLLIGVAFPLSLRPAVAVTTRATIQAMRSRGSEESSWYLESQVTGEEQVVQEEPHNEEFDLI